MNFFREDSYVELCAKLVKQIKEDFQRWALIWAPSAIPKGSSYPGAYEIGDDDHHCQDEEVLCNHLPGILLLLSRQKDAQNPQNEKAP